MQNPYRLTQIFLASNLRVGIRRDVALMTWLVVAAAIAFVAYIARMNAITHDAFHEMALAREWLQSGSFPLTDRFAYTPTVEQAVHHEWGTGVLLYFAGPESPLGLHGIMALRFALVAALGVLLYRVARTGGAHPILFAAFLPIVLPVIWVGFANLRAQLFTLVFLAAQLLMQQSDWRGSRKWIFAWIPMYLIWLNLHAGFVVGLGMLGFHLIERIVDAWWRKQSIIQSVRHLLLMGPVIGLGLLCNPWGMTYVTYLFAAITMERPAILEWRPLWFTYDPLTTLVAFTISIVMLGYVAKTRQWHRLRGWMFCALSAYMALKHIRHGSIYGVIWMATVPAWITPTPLGRSLVAWINQSRYQAIRISQGLATVCALFAVSQGFWLTALPSDLQASSFCYPVGAVQFLRQHGVHGNVMTPFHTGAYVSWELHPQVKVSIDGRYEVAYREDILPLHQAFYDAAPDWRSTLSRFEHDFILIPRDSKIATELLKPHPIDGWDYIYSDHSFGLIARSDLGFPSLGS